MDLSLRKEDLPTFFSHVVNVLERNQIWVAMSVGTLVINEGIMRGRIHPKLLSLICTNLGSLPMTRSVDSIERMNESE